MTTKLALRTRQARATIALGLLAVVAACSSDPTVPAPADDASRAARDAVTPLHLELLVGRARVDLLDARLAPEPRPASPSYPGPSALRWELHAPDGALRAAGAAEDPRFARDESALLDEDGHAHGAARDPRVPATLGTVRVEVPNEDGEVVVFDARGEVGRTRVSALRSDRAVQPLFSPSRDLVGAPAKIVDHGASGSLVNLLVVPEGYTRAELSKFHDDTDSMITALRAVRGYTEFWHGINVWRQDIASQDSGITDPLEATPKSTAFDAAFGDDRTMSRRCVMPGDTVRAQALANLRATMNATGADVVVILVNEDEYAGCALPSEHVIIQSRHAQAPRILAHELGHEPFLLADEYEYGDCDPSRWQPGSEWNAVNVSNALRALPWSDLVNTSQLPTPVSAGAGVVGAFDGAGYCQSGVYRPQASCLMRALSGDWCKVCYRELVRFWAARGVAPAGAGGDAGADGGGSGVDAGADGGGASDAGSGTSTDAGAPPDAGGAGDAGTQPPVLDQVAVTNRTGAGLWVRCAGTVGTSCSDWTYLYSGYYATLKAPGGRLYIDNSTVGTVRTRFSWRPVTAPAASISIYANATDPLRP